MLCVKVFWPDGHPITRSFTKNEVLIGRKSTNDIILAGQDVSGTHACLQIENGCVTLVDLGSTNGTFVNSERVQVSAQLAPADEIKISVFTLHVSVGDEQSAAPPNAGGDPASAEPPSPQPPSLRRPGPPTPGAAPPPSSPMPGPPIAPMVGPAEPRAPTGPLPQITDVLPIVPARRGAIPPPPVRRAPGPEALAPPPYGPPGPLAGPAGADEGPPIADDDPPPTARTARVASSREAPPPPVITTPGSASRDAETTDLARVWADPEVRRLVIDGLGPALVERDGVCSPLGEGFSGVEDLRDRLAALCGRPVPRDVPTECVLADGTAVQAILDGVPLVILTRPRRGAPVTLEQDRDLPELAARLLVGCARAKLPLLIVARPGAACAPLLAALLAEVQGAAGYVRGLPTPVVAPRGCTAVDAGHGGGHMAAAMRLLLATDAGSLAIDEPEAAALDECVWAHAEGRGVLVGVRAASLEHALLRARSTGADRSSFAPTIAYALAVVLGADPLATAAIAGERDTNGGSFRVTRIVELRHGEASPNIHEIFGPGRRGELLAIAAPALLGELARRGVDIAGDLFTRS